MDELTQKIISIIKNCNPCLQSIKQSPCFDYEARFGAYIRSKHGVVITNIVNWPLVKTTIENEILK